MRRLLPSGPPIVELPADIAAEERCHPDERPWVLANFVVSLDGGIEIGGRSAALSNEADRAMFRALRSIADVVLVGAETARAERYRLPSLAPGGDGRSPRLCVVSRSLDLDGDLPFLGPGPAGHDRAILITTSSSDPSRRAALADACEVVALDGDDVSPDELVTALGALGLRTVLCEGGPTLIGQLTAAGLIDEWNLTIAPRMAGGDARRLSPAGTGPTAPMRLTRVFADGDHVFARYLTR